jgi:hypothetical protein
MSLRTHATRSATSGHPPRPAQRALAAPIPAVAARQPPRGAAGRPLPAAARRDMEAFFGHDFSSVRVHEGPQAPSLGAVAYTQGNDIHFSPGKFRPEGAAGRELLGHELTHVVQQRAGRVPVPQGSLGKRAPINADPALEAEADGLGRMAARSARPPAAGGGGACSCARCAAGRRRALLSSAPARRAGAALARAPMAARTPASGNPGRPRTTPTLAPSAVARAGIARQAQAPAQRAAVQRFCGHPACTDPGCHSRTNHPPTVQDVRASLDPLAELQHASATSRARFDFQSLGAAAMPPNLAQTAEVRGRQRTMAEVTSPSDRLLLAAQERTPSGHYVQIQQRPALSSAPIVTGRLQDPQSAHLPRERYIYEQGAWGPPSYPREASHFNAMVSSGSMTSPQVFGQIQNAMMAAPLATGSESEQRHLMTTANILGIAEQRRDPYMALTSAQTIADAATPGSALTPTSVFGQQGPARGRGRRPNLPGRLPASGTGATADFRAFHADVAGGIQPASDSGQRLFTNVQDTHLRLGEQGFDEAAVNRLHREGMSREFIMEGQQARMRSAATREAAMMTGQLRYRLRSLRRDRRFSPY